MLLVPLAPKDIHDRACSLARGLSALLNCVELGDA